MSQQLGLPLAAAAADAPQTLASVQAANPARLCECGCGLNLTGRQKRFATRLCNTRYWDQQHPRINRGPAGPREGTILHAMLALMADGLPRTALEIADAVRAREHSVSARLADARKRGYVIESDAVNGNSRRAHRFRLLASA